jgi:hypothetical protein
MFFWAIYDFGPKHLKQSFIDIFKNPVPGIAFEGSIGETDDFDSFWHLQFNHNLIACQIAQTKRLTPKWIAKSSVPIVHDCPILHFDLTAPQLHGYETYFTMHSESIGKRVTESENSMPMTLYFAICQFSCLDFVFSELPRMPTKGFITYVLVNTLITGIFGIITFLTCILLYSLKVCISQERRT